MTDSFNIPPQSDLESLTAYVHRLEKRVEQLEANQLRWFTDARPAPQPQRDTNWVPYKVGDDHPNGDERVVVMLRKNGEIHPPHRAGSYGWTEIGTLTIIAWRYAKEGE
jgi:hypothetical protein